MRWKDLFWACGRKTGKQRESCFTDLSEFAEIMENYRDAAEAAEAVNNFERAKKMWLVESERLEKEGYYWDASEAAKLAGEEGRAQRLRDIVVV